MSASRCPLARASLSAAVAVPAPEGVGTLARSAVGESGRFIPYITQLKGEDTLSLDNVGCGLMGGVWTSRTGRRRTVTGAVRCGCVTRRRSRDGRSRCSGRCTRGGRGGDARHALPGLQRRPRPQPAGHPVLRRPPDPSRRNRNWPDVEYTHHPPVCLPCAHQAMLACPFVQHAPALRVRNPRPWGIDGIAYAPAPTAPSGSTARSTAAPTTTSSSCRGRSPSSPLHASAAAPSSTSTPNWPPPD